MGTREAQSVAFAFDFARVIQKPVSSFFVSVKAPSITLRLTPENETRAPSQLAWSPSVARNTPAFAVSSLNFPIAATSYLLGNTPASEFLAALDAVPGEWGAEEVAAELFEAGAIGGGDPDVIVEIEAVELSLAGPAGADVVQHQRMEVDIQL